jgi:hypothetical protein
MELRRSTINVLSDEAPVRDNLTKFHHYTTAEVAPQLQNVPLSHSSPDSTSSANSGADLQAVPLQHPNSSPTNSRSLPYQLSSYPGSQTSILVSPERSLTGRSRTGSAAHDMSILNGDPSDTTHININADQEVSSMAAHSSQLQPPSGALAVVSMGNHSSLHVRTCNPSPMLLMLKRIHN